VYSSPSAIPQRVFSLAVGTKSGVIATARKATAAKATMTKSNNSKKAKVTTTIRRNQPAHTTPAGAEWNNILPNSVTTLGGRCLLLERKTNKQKKKAPVAFSHV